MALIVAGPERVCERVIAAHRISLQEDPLADSSHGLTLRFDPVGEYPGPAPVGQVVLLRCESGGIADGTNDTFVLRRQERPEEYGEDQHSVRATHERQAIIGEPDDNGEVGVRGRLEESLDLPLELTQLRPTRPTFALGIAGWDLVVAGDFIESANQAGEVEYPGQLVVGESAGIGGRIIRLVRALQTGERRRWLEVPPTAAFRIVFAPDLEEGLDEREL
jgi:hypothetical protein